MMRIAGERFVDDEGRTLLLRGVNLGGSTKVPVHPNGATHLREGFFEHRAVSFVGRPFPLEEADEHFARLRHWGMTFLRFLVTWEGIEHAGPGIYDEAYLDYVVAVVRKAADYGINLFIDPHQDVWSRFTGGDGAPGWTLEAVGLRLEALHEAGAAFLHQEHGDPFPRMIWPTNGSKLAAATLFTLFFAGNDFAPHLQIDGEPVQDYLQRHYCAAIAQLAGRLKDCPNVVGYDTLNEPLHGYIGARDLNQFEGLLKIGPSPTPFQGMALGAGFPQQIAHYSLSNRGIKRIGTQTVNAKRIAVWRDEAADIWRREGVWDVGPDGAPRLLRPDYFAAVEGKPVNFSQDYYRRFANRFAATIRAAHPGTLIFVETETSAGTLQWGPEDARDIIYAPHWYDALLLLLKQFNPLIALDSTTTKVVIGPRAVRKLVARDLGAFQQQVRERMGGVPVLIGEIGIPFDLAGSRAFQTGDYSTQMAAAERSWRGLEDTRLSGTWWNYTPDNDHAHGDQWNGEDLSIFSRDEQHGGPELDDGGRALDAIVRPYPRAVAGELLALRFDRRRGTFSCTFHHDPQVTAPTEIFVPNRHYPRGYRVTVSDGTFEEHPDRQLLIYRHTTARAEHTISLHRR